MIVSYCVVELGIARVDKQLCTTLSDDHLKFATAIGYELQVLDVIFGVNWTLSVALDLRALVRFQHCIFSRVSLRAPEIVRVVIDEWSHPIRGTLSQGFVLGSLVLPVYSSCPSTSIIWIIVSLTEDVALCDCGSPESAVCSRAGEVAGDLIFTDRELIGSLEVRISGVVHFEFDGIGCENVCLELVHDSEVGLACVFVVDAPRSNIPNDLRSRNGLCGQNSLLLRSTQSDELTRGAVDALALHELSGLGAGNTSSHSCQSE